MWSPPARWMDRLGSELGEDRPQRADARRERVGVVLNDVVQFFDERGGLFVRQIKVHYPDMGSRLPGQTFLAALACEDAIDA